MEFFPFKQKINNKTIIASAVSVLLMLCLIIFIAYIPLFGHGKEKEQETVVLFLGDSNFVQDYGNGSIPEQFIRETGFAGYNCAKGGTLASDSNQSNNPDKIASVMDLSNLIRVIGTRNLLPLKGAGKIMKKEFPQYQIISTLNYDSVDYVFLNYALNDYANGVKIADKTNPYNTHTYCGAMRFAIEEIEKLFPNASIIAGSITYNVYVSDGTVTDGYDYSYGGGTTREYRDALEAVCKEYERVIFLDNLNGFGIDYNNYQDYLADNMHLHVNGQKKYVDAMKNAILENEK